WGDTSSTRSPLQVRISWKVAFRLSHISEEICSRMPRALSRAEQIDEKIESVFASSNTKNCKMLRSSSASYRARKSSSPPEIERIELQPMVSPMEGSSRPKW